MLASCDFNRAEKMPDLEVLALTRTFTFIPIVSCQNLRNEGKMFTYL
jgi:hypothetical protein